MNILQAIILGIIQGITEWFPVSSSGHLVIAKYYLDLEPSLSFDVFVHFGSAAVVLLIFRKEVHAVITAFFAALKDLPTHGTSAMMNTPERRLAFLIIIASIPTGIIGLTISYFYEGILSEPRTVGMALLITAVVLLSTRSKLENRGAKDMNMVDALLIGTMQGMAAVPGISRSGFTISSGLLRGIDRRVAVRYSFLLFLPAILAAGLLQARDITGDMDHIPIIVGVITAMIVGYITIIALLKLIERGWFHYFAIYCVTVGTFLILTT